MGLFIKLWTIKLQSLEGYFDLVVWLVKTVCGSLLELTQFYYVSWIVMLTKNTVFS